MSGNQTAERQLCRIHARQRNAVAWPSPDRPLRAVPGGDGGSGGRGADAGERAGERPESSDPSTQRTAAATVLIVDDERDIRFLLRFVLEKNGYRVLEAVHGANALELIASEKPALVISDLMMPVMDGSELISSLRDAAATAHIPAILVSACPERATREGFDRVMRKPFLPSDLVAAVKELLERNAS